MFKILKNLFNKNTNKTDNNKLTEMAEINLDKIITPGFYQLNSTENSEHKVIVKIVRKLNPKSSIWVDNDGKQYSEYDLQDAYTRIDMVANQKVVASKQAKMQMLFDGFDDIASESVDIADAQVPNQPLRVSDNIASIVETAQEYDTNVNQTKVQIQERIVEKEVEKFVPIHYIPTSVDDKVKGLLEMMNIEFLTNQEIKKYGAAQTKRHNSIEIPLTLKLNYDLSKIKSVIELFEVPLDVILSYVVLESFKSEQAIKGLQRDIVEQLKKHYEPAAISNEKPNNGNKEVSEIKTEILHSDSETTALDELLPGF